MGEEEYVVEAIRDRRYNMRLKEREFLIKWQGYEEEENTWEPEGNLNCPGIIESFKRTLPLKELRCLMSRRPEKLSGFERAKFIQCIGADGPHESDNEDSPKEDEQNFYCLIVFDDIDFPEEVTMSQFHEHRPYEAFAYCEDRILRRRCKSRSSRD